MVSDLEYGSVNYKEGCWYIAANKTEIWCKQSDLRRILTTRQNAGGVRPGPTGEDTMGQVGGHIGLRSMGAIGRVVMAMTDRRVKSRMASTPN